MNTFNRIAILGLLAVAACSAQVHSVLQTSLSAAIGQSDTTFAVASATGINAPTASVPGSMLYVVDVGQILGEPMPVLAISSTTVMVRRTQGRASAHASGAMVLVATAPNWFYSVDPVGTCTAASVFANPWVNIETGHQWLCSAKTGTWVAGWGNPRGSPQVPSGTATASVGGATAIAGPYLEISGTNAITQFNMSVGWNGQGFCAYPTGGWTITATNNISKAATAVADRTLCFSYDVNSGKFSPGY